MTLFQYMNEQFSYMQNVDFFVRILIACFCGGVIGFERSRRLKDAGIRTHVIVCCTAALIMIISKYGFVDLFSKSGEWYNGVRGADPARIAAQAVSGVSFLGAGAIFHNKNYTKGLTTAAGIWATAGIGMAIGGGMVVIGVFTTALIMVLQTLLHFFTYGLDSVSKNYMEFEVNDKKAFKESLALLEKETKGNVVESSIRKGKNDSYRYKVIMQTRKDIQMKYLDDFVDQHPEIESVSLKYL